MLQFSAGNIIKVLYLPSLADIVDFFQAFNVFNEAYFSLSRSCKGPLDAASITPRLPRDQLDEDNYAHTIQQLISAPTLER